MNIPYLINPGKSVTVMLPGQEFTAAADHPKFNEILKTLISPNGDVGVLKSLFDLVKPVADYLGTSGLTIRHGAVSFNGQPVANYTTDKIIQFMEAGLPSGPIIKFLERLLQNPSKRAVSELYAFLEHRNMPLTSNGFFRAYKGVNANYMDKHTGKFSNHIGADLVMLRNEVDDDARQGCSAGFHAGSLRYASDWAGSDGHLMVVEIDPADVVSVPFDCDCQKLRTWRYKVVDELKDRLPMSDTYINADDEGMDDGFEECVNCGDTDGDCDCLCDMCGAHVNERCWCSS